jgi:hypothetical protein
MGTDFDITSIEAYETYLLALQHWKRATKNN